MSCATATLRCDPGVSAWELDELDLVLSVSEPLLTLMADIAPTSSPRCRFRDPPK